MDLSNREFRKRVRGLTSDARTLLEHYRWPGNVRVHWLSSSESYFPRCEEHSQVGARTADRNRQWQAVLPPSDARARSVATRQS